jgi:hypothetical protein
MTETIAVGPAVYFGPYRTIFNRDVTITITYDAELAQSQKVTPYVYNHLTRAWDELEAESYVDGSLVFKTQVLGLFQAAVDLPAQADLKYFFARMRKKGRKVVVKWKTVIEEDIGGFHLYRNIDGGEYARLNPALIPPKGSAKKGGRYRFVEKDLSPDKTYGYKLEIVATNGARSTIGPVIATYGKPEK